MRNLSFSIAMCTYNGSHYLGPQLESIAAQKRMPDELVVCDDRSSDDTVSLVNHFARTAPFPVKIFINEKNLGYTKNFEKVIGLCEGDIIALSDQDDVWHPDKLHRMEVIFTSRPDVGGVFSNARLVDADLTPFNNTLWDVIRFTRREQDLVREGRSIDVLMRHPIVTGATFGFRSLHRNHILPIPAGWVHDGWIALIVATISRLEITEEELVYYRQHPESQIGAREKSPITRFDE